LVECSLHWFSFLPRRGTSSFFFFFCIRYGGVTNTRGVREGEECATEMLIAPFYRNDRRINERERFACERKMGRNNAGIIAHYRVTALRNRYLYRTRRGVVRRQDFDGRENR